MEAFARVIMKTPVDTGRLRANWMVSEGSINTTQVDATDPAGSGAVDAMRSAVQSLPVEKTIYLSNSLPYASVVEYGLYPNPPKGGAGKTEGGFSKQAPAGMVRVTAQEIEGIFSEAVSKLK